MSPMVKGSYCPCGRVSSLVPTELGTGSVSFGSLVWMETVANDQPHTLGAAWQRCHELYVAYIILWCWKGWFTQKPHTVSETFDHLLHLAAVIFSCAIVISIRRKRRVNVLSSLSFSQTPGRHAFAYQDCTVMCDDLEYYKLEDAGRVSKNNMCFFFGGDSGGHSAATRDVWHIWKSWTWR